MTTTILAVIGIILAAFTAMAVIYFGQTSFDEANTKASVGRLMNEGVQIQAASKLFQTKEGRDPGSTGTDFMDDLISNGYLTHEPSGMQQGLGTNVSTAWSFDSERGIARSVIGSSSNATAQAVCTEARKQVGLTGAPLSCDDPAITTMDPCCVLPESAI